MEKILLKKSFRVKDLKIINFNSLWGYKGIFTTIRLVGNKPKLILAEEHIKKLNRDSSRLSINYKLSKEFLLNFINNNSKIKNYDHLLRVAITKKILDDHNGTILFKPLKGSKGTSVILKFPLISKLKKRKMNEKK